MRHPIDALTYDHARQLTSAAAANGQVTRMQYNAAGRVESVGNAAGEFAHSAIDIEANTVRQSSQRMVPGSSNGVPHGTNDGEFSGTTVLDSLGRPYTAFSNGGQRLDLRYDANGNLVSQTDAGGHKTSFFYDGQNRLVRIVAPDERLSSGSVQGVPCHEPGLRGRRMDRSAA